MERDIRDSEKTINWFAYRVARRLAGLNQSAVIDDIKQELAIAWCIARDTYDPECGASFKTYLTNGMRLHINRHIEKQYERRMTEVMALSLDMPTNSDEGSGTLGDVVPSADPAIDLAIEEQSIWNHVSERLSDKAKMFLSFVRERPDLLMDNVDKIRIRTEYARSRGISTFAFLTLNASVLFDFMDVSKSERKAILDEIRELGDEMCEAER